MDDSWQSKLERLMVTLGNVGPAIDDELSHVYQRAEYDAIEIRMLREQLEIANLMLESRNRLVTRISHLETDLRNITARAERAVQAEAELAEMTIERDAAQRALYDLEQSAEAQNVMRAQGMIDAAIARAERAEAVVSAIPWQTLLDLSNYTDLLHQRETSALLEFLNQYAPWVPNESEG